MNNNIRMNLMPKISVITVSYNAVETIETTILSVIHQTYENIEYIIIDGGSTDGTVDVIKKYQDKLAYWVSEPDKGIYDAMNKGIEVVNGDFVYFIGADDIMCCNILNEVAIQMTDLELIYYGDVIMQPTGKRYLGRFNKLKLLRKNISHQAIFYPYKVFSSGRRYTQKYKLLADYLLNLDLWSEGWKFNYLNKDIASFQLLGASSIGDKDFVRDRSQIIYNRFNKFDYIYFVLTISIIAYLKIRIKDFLKK